MKNRGVIHALRPRPRVASKEVADSFFQIQRSFGATSCQTGAKSITSRRNACTVPGRN